MSPLMAAVCLTEASFKSKTSRKKLFVATLNTQRTFDVVSDHILMADLVQTDTPDDLWLAVKTLY